MLLFSTTPKKNQRIDISKWQTGKVVSMKWMFRGTKVFNRDLSKWNPQKVTTMHGMFELAPLFNADISRWNTDAAKTMKNMFLNSGYKRSLCGGGFSTLTGDNGAFNNVGTSTARQGCCSQGK